MNNYKACIILIDVIQDMEKKQKKVNKVFDSTEGFEFILYSPLVGNLMDVLLEILELPKVPEEFEELGYSLEWKDYIYDLVNDFSKSPEEIYEEIYAEVKSYTESIHSEEESQNVINVMPAVKESINKYLELSGGLVQEPVESMIETALNMAAQFQNRELSERETKELREILVDYTISADELYREIKERQVF